jgi:hypothetical protein
MAKRKEIEDMLSDNLVIPEQTTVTATETISDVVIDELDFNELLELEKAARATEEQLNKLAGIVYRYSKEQELYYNHEKKLNAEIDTKRKDLLKRYRLDEQRPWKIDINSRKVVYS